LKGTLLSFGAASLFLATAFAGLGEEPVFSAVRKEAASPLGDQGQLTDAEAYFRRGARFLAKQDFNHAIADFDRALEMKPGEPRYLYFRSEALLKNRQQQAGMADLDELIASWPNSVGGLLRRAELSASSKDGRERARADLDRVDRLLARHEDLRLTMAAIYERLGDWKAVVKQLDLWLASHPEDDRRARPLRNRCGARALLGTELSQALEDCNESLRLAPMNNTTLGNRATVYLRMERLDFAIDDYDAALSARRSDSGWLLFGRGLAKIRRGFEVEGRADIAASLAISKALPSFAQSIGLIQTATNIR
jgi:tetratricopeptide (TPR) repeat protein